MLALALTAGFAAPAAAAAVHLARAADIFDRSIRGKTDQFVLKFRKSR